MKKTALFLGAILFASVAFAQIDKGQIGIGGDIGLRNTGNSNDVKTSSFNIQPNVFFGIADNLLINGNFGINIQGSESPNFESTTKTVSFGVGLTKLIPLNEQLSLPVSFGTGMGFASIETNSGGVMTTGEDQIISLGLGTGAIWFPTQYLSLYVEVGILNFDFISDQNSDFTETEVIAFDGFTDLLGQAGVVVWFK